jgi:TatD DNase family protein
MRLFDTHCHVDLYPDYTNLIDEVERTKVYTVAVTNTPSVFRQSSSLTAGKKYLRTALGLHPQLVGQRHRELNLMFDLLGETKYVGEIGLDFVTSDEHDRALQRKIFASILDRCAMFGDKVLTIHSRRAAEYVVNIIGASFSGIVILHWFSGSLNVLEKAVSNGYYFSVNPAMVISSKGQQIISAIPRDRLLTESDGPFVTVEGKAARPRDVRKVVSALAELFDMSQEAVAEMLFGNFKNALRESEASKHQGILSD